MNHSDFICFLIGLTWVFSGAFAIFSFFSYDQNRLSEITTKLYNRWRWSAFIFGLASAVFILHYVIHPE